MKFHKTKIVILVVAGILSLAMLAGCSGSEKKSEDKKSQKTETMGTFETTDIEGNSYTEKIFQDYDLTMVNIFATWCSPCVSELPDLEKLHKEIADQNVNVVGIVTDAVDEQGNQDKEALEVAKTLKERSGVTYPLLIPDAEGFGGRLNTIDCFPTTIFVDKDGNIIGETYEGSGSFEDWKEIVEQELANLKGER